MQKNSSIKAPLGQNSFRLNPFDRGLNRAVVQEAAWPHWIAIKNNVFLFGIEWELSPFSSGKNKELENQRKNGKSCYATSPLEDVVGYIGAAPHTKNKNFAAALHLADRYSQGGIEIFCFQIKKDEYSFIALNDSKPVPGHDYIGNKENVWELGSDFANLQENQAIRYIGNSGIFEMEEPLTLEKAFGNPQSTSQFRTIHNRPLIITMAFCVLISLGIIVGIDSYITHLKAKEEKERLALLNDPNRLYEQNIEKALNKLSAGGRIQIDNWMDTIGKMPLKISGWRLEKVKCTIENCTASWKRIYGNFSDLFVNIPIPVMSSSEQLDAAKPENSTAITVHALSSPILTNKLERKDLPKIKEVLSQLNSQMQDLSLLDNSSVSIEKPVLFPSTAQGTMDTLQKPVLSGTWSLQLELWTLSSLKISPYLMTESLEISFSDGKNPTVYSLKGSYYANYK